MLEECIKILQTKANQSTKHGQCVLGDFLQHIPYFKGICSKEELSDRLYDLAKYVEYEEIEENKAVFHKGEQSQYMYFILKGHISVFIPKAPHDIDLEVKWRTQLEILNDDYKNINPSSLLANQNRSQIQSQINQGKSILRCLRNQEDEELIKINYFQKYFRQNGTVCGYKKISGLSEYDSFGESILSESNALRTATLIAHKGVLLKSFKMSEDEITSNSNKLQEENLLLSENLQLNQKNLQSPQEDNSDKLQPLQIINTLSSESKSTTSNENTFQITQNSNQDIQNDIINQKIQQDSSPSNAFQTKKLILLGKISKKNYLKVFQQELEKRTFIRRALTNNFKDSLEEGVVDNIAFFFKEEHLEKNTKIVKEIETSNGNNQSNNGFMSERRDYNQERKREQELLNHHQISKPFQDEEYLYLLYRGQIQIRKKMTSSYNKSQIKNIDSSLQESAMSRVNKVDLKLAQLSEGEFFGHENWFKEDIERMFSYIGDVSPMQAFQDKLVSIKKDFSIIALETDTIIYKIPRKILCEEQNRVLLKSLIQHGKKRHTRYMQLSKDSAEKEEENILKKMQAQNEYFLAEKDSKQQQQAVKFSSQKAENFLRGGKRTSYGSNIVSENNLDDADVSPIFKKELVKEFDSFKMRFENAFNTSIQPIQNTKSTIRSHQRGFSQVELSNNQPTLTAIRQTSKRQSEINSQVYSSHNFASVKDESQMPMSLNNLDQEEQFNVKNDSSPTKKNEFIIRQAKKQRSTYSVNFLPDDTALKNIPSIPSTNNIAAKFTGSNDQKLMTEEQLRIPLSSRQDDDYGIINKNVVENFNSKNTKIIPFFTEPFNQTRDRIIRKFIKSGQGNPQIPKFSSMNVSPTNEKNKDMESGFEQSLAEFNQKTNYLKLKLQSQKSFHQGTDVSPVMIKQMSLNSQLSNQKQNSQQAFSFVSAIGSYTARNSKDDRIIQDEEKSSPTTVIKTLNLSPRKIQHKSTRSLISLSKVQGQQQQGQTSNLSITPNEQNTKNSQEQGEYELEKQQNSTFSQILSKISKTKINEEQNPQDMVGASPSEKRVKFQAQLGEQNQRQIKSPIKLAQYNNNKGSIYMKSLQKQIPIMKNSFLQQINLKKDLLKNEFARKSFSSLYEPSNKSLNTNTQGTLTVQKSVYVEDKSNKQSERQSGFYSSRDVEPDIIQIQNFNSTSQQIYNTNIPKTSNDRRQSQKAFQANSAQNSPRNSVNKIKTSSIHTNYPLQNNLFNQQQLASSSFRPQIPLQQQKNKLIQQFIQTQSKQNKCLTEGDQQSDLPYNLNDNYWKDASNQNIRVFEGHIQKSSDVISINETKIQSAQDLDTNTQSQESGISSQEINSSQKQSSVFSQFKINKQQLFDIPKKTISKQIIQNCFKKK